MGRVFVPLRARRLRFKDAEPVDPVECGYFVAFGQSQVIEHRVDEVISLESCGLTQRGGRFNFSPVWTRARRYCTRFHHEHQVPDFRLSFVNYVSDRVLHCYTIRDATLYF